MTPTTPPPLYILAGGHSRRFGSDKARALVDGRAMIQRVAEAFAPVCASVTVVAQHQDQYADLGFHTIADEVPDAGPLAGLHTALQHARRSDAPFIALAACDLRAPSTEALQTLLDCFNDQHPACVYTTGDFHEPFPGLYRTALAPKAGQHLRDGQHSMQAFLQALMPHLKTLDVPAEHPTIADMDTPDGQRVVMVTGSSRGIGLEFVRQCLKRGDRVLATCRNPKGATALQEIAQHHGERCVVLLLDVADPASIDAAVAQASHHVDRIDLLINNAGCGAHGEEGLKQLDAEQMVEVFRVNTLGPLLVTRAALPLLKRSGRGVVASLTSGSGVLFEGMTHAPGQQFSYATTKAALNRALPQLAAELHVHGIGCVGISPGFVETDMTRGYAAGRKQLRPEESVAGMLQLLDTLDTAESTVLWDWNGQRCHWSAP